MARKKSYKPHFFESTTSNEHYTRLYDSMLKSDAWKDLNHSSRSVYTILKMQYKGEYTGETVLCPYKDFQEYGMNTTTIKNAIKDLEEHGFIRCEHGVLVTGNLHREPNEYRFISEWKDWHPDDNL